MKQFAVIGLGNFGLNVALKLSDMGMPVLVIDKDPAKIESISGKVAYARVADATDKKSLESAGVAAVNTAVVSLGKQIEPSVMATIILKELGVPEVIVKGTTPEHG
ncbi:MAG TPA: TrkA family potassium uptake protein, partial [candidate division Zixibacteria bacterium]|nr:TrkA family potassium uptake protein [candidate division Zixibacteria bacterium]